MHKNTFCCPKQNAHLTEHYKTQKEARYSISNKKIGMEVIGSLDQEFKTNIY